MGAEYRLQPGEYVLKGEKCTGIRKGDSSCELEDFLMLTNYNLVFYRNGSPERRASSIQIYPLDQIYRFCKVPQVTMAQTYQYPILAITFSEGTCASFSFGKKSTPAQIVSWIQLIQDQILGSESRKYVFDDSRRLPALIRGSFGAMLSNAKDALMAFLSSSGPASQQAEESLRQSAREFVGELKETMEQTAGFVRNSSSDAPEEDEEQPVIVKYCDQCGSPLRGRRSSRVVCSTCGYEHIF